MSLFPQTLKCKSQNWDFLLSQNFGCSYLYKKKVFLECTRVISYNPQNYLSNGVLQAQIKDHLTPFLRGFVVESQIFNLTPNPSFDHNLCILGLNEQCEGNLGI